MFDNLRRWWKSDKSGKRPARKNPLRQWSFRPMLEALEPRWVPSAPTVTAVSPGSGPLNGYTEVEIAGSGFTNATAVDFAGVPASTFWATSDSVIYAYTPWVPPTGTVDVTVVNPDGTSATSSADQFTFVGPPAVTSVSPGDGPMTGDTLTLINGSGFTGATAVTFGGVSAPSYQVLSDTQILATSPSLANPLEADVRVTAPTGTSALTGGDVFDFTDATTPVVMSVSQNSGPTAGGTEVEIDGSGFTGTTAVDFGSAAALNYCIVADNVLLAWSPAEATGVTDITVTTSYGTSATSSADHFTYVPSVTAVTPDSGPTAGGTAVVIDGSGFTGATVVDFGSTAASFTVVSDSVIDATAPAGSAGTVDITVATSSGTSATSSADQFTYAQASSTTLSSSENPANYGDSVTFTAVVSGSGAGTPTGTVTFMDGSTALGTATLSSTWWGVQATFTTSALALGAHPITAVYSGDSNFAGSTSSVVNQNVTSSTAYVWVGGDTGDPNDWNDAANWQVNGTTATTVPGSTNDVLFSSVDGSDLDCATNGEGTVSVNSVTIDSSYTSTLTLNDDLDVGAGGFNMAGGNTNQPGTTILVTNGVVNWSGGVLDSGTILGTLYAANSPIQLNGTNLTSGATFVVDGNDAFLNLTGTWTFNNNAGISLKNTALFKWSSATAKIVTTGTGIIKNDSSVFVIATGANGAVVTSDLPYDNEGGNLEVQIGTIVFDKAGPSGVSLLQNSGNIYLGQDNQQGATLEVDNGLKMNGGGLITAAGEDSNINDGDITITDGNVQVGNLKGSGGLFCDGNVTMSGGDYSPSIDLTANANTYTTWLAKSFTFTVGNTAALAITSVNIPAVLPKNVSYHILKTPANNSISGDFGGGKSVAIGNTGTSYTALPDANKKNYDARL